MMRDLMGRTWKMTRKFGDNGDTLGLGLMKVKHTSGGMKKTGEEDRQYCRISALGLLEWTRVWKLFHAV